MLIVAWITFTPLHAQINVSNQLNTIPENLSTYADFYLKDLTAHQGFVYLNNVSATGRVLGQWELNLSLKLGSGLSQELLVPQFGENFQLSGGMPTLFGTEEPGKLFFQFLDEATGVPIVNPFSGEIIGFGLPLFPGLGTSLGFSPAIIPTLSLGIGYGTEVSFGILPGAIKLSTSNLAEGFSISKDVTTTFGLRHDVFHWIPALHDKKFSLSLGVQCNLLNIGVNIGPDMLGSIDAPSCDKFEVAYNLTGLAYKSSSVGFEALLTKKFGFLDLSLFSSFNQIHYQVISTGGIEVKVAKSFYSNIASGFDSYIIDELINVNQKVDKFIFGLALKLNLGRFNLDLKAAPFSGHYYAFGLGFKILQNK